MLERTRMWNARSSLPMTLPMTSTPRPSPPKTLHLPSQPRTATPRVVVVTGMVIHLQARSPDPAEMAVEVKRVGGIGRATERISARRTGETGAAVPTRAVVVAIGALAVVAQASAVIAYLVAAVAESTATVAGVAGVIGADSMILN